jgi:hypothetical protein
MRVKKRKHVVRMNLFHAFRDENSFNRGLSIKDNEKKLFLKGFRKNSQVTLFIILTILVLVMVSVGLIMLSNFNKNLLATSRERARDKSLDYTRFNTYMKMCLDDSLKDALVLIGRQGGFIFSGQEASIIDFEIKSDPFLDDDGRIYNVTYITDNALPSFVMNPPGYPCFSKDYFESYAVNMRPPVELIGEQCTAKYRHNMQFSEQFFQPQYQKVRGNLLRTVDVPLCSKLQEIIVVNYSLTDAQGNYFNVTRSVCEPSPFEAKNKYSIQNQTEEFIKNRMHTCLNGAISFITNQMDAEIHQIGNVSVNVVFGDDFTSANVDFPITLSFLKTDTSSKSFTYHSSAKVRLKAIYALLYGQDLLLMNKFSGSLRNIPRGIIDMDMQDILFDIGSDSLDFMAALDIQGVDVMRIYDDHGSIIKIVDNASEIKGEPYSYHVRMHNRIPALDAIPQQYPVAGYDMYFRIGSALTIRPLALDLDDEGKPGNELLYSYEILNEDWKWREESLHNNPLYLEGSDPESQNPCSHPKYGITKNRCTRIILNESDVGMHTLRVKVMDHGQLTDSQDIKIFVDMPSNLTFEIENIYGDIQNAYTFSDGIERYIVSNEDPFIIDASESTFPLGPFVNQLKWEDATYTKSHISSQSYQGYYPVGTFFSQYGGPSNFNQYNDPKFKFKDKYPLEYFASNKSIVHPGYEDFTEHAKLERFLNIASGLKANIGLNENAINILKGELKDYLKIFDIRMRWGYPFVPNPTTAYLGSARKSSLVLTYLKNRADFQSETKQIYITSCMPHRSETPIFPFNLIATLGDKRDLNPFNANHTCCIGSPDGNPENWAVADEGEVCYSSEEFGSYDEFVLNPLTNISLALFKEMHPYFSDFSKTALVPNIAPYKDRTFDIYVRKIKGECDGLRGNICNPTVFSIEKLPYCGQDLAVYSSYNYNKQIKDTQLPSFYYYGQQNSYYSEGLCICKEGSESRIMNISNTTTDQGYGVAHNELYCCTDDNHLPVRLSALPCEITPCRKFDVTSTPKPFTDFMPSFSHPKIGDTFSYFSYQDSNPYCSCGENPDGTLFVVNASDPNIANMYCCNPSLVPFFTPTGTIEECYENVFDPNSPSVPSQQDPSPIALGCTEFCEDNGLGSPGVCRQTTISNLNLWNFGSSYATDPCDGMVLGSQDGFCGDSDSWSHIKNVCCCAQDMGAYYEGIFQDIVESCTDDLGDSDSNYIDDDDEDEEDEEDYSEPDTECVVFASRNEDKCAELIGDSNPGVLNECRETIRLLNRLKAVATGQDIQCSNLPNYQKFCEAISDFTDINKCDELGFFSLMGAACWTAFGTDSCKDLFIPEDKNECYKFAYTAKAIRTADPTECDNIPYPYSRLNCLSYFSQDESLLCDGYVKRMLCEEIAASEVASESRDSAWCQRIYDDSFRQECYQTLGVYTFSLPLGPDITFPSVSSNFGFIRHFPSFDDDANQECLEDCSSLGGIYNSGVCFSYSYPDDNPCPITQRIYSGLETNPCSTTLPSTGVCCCN